MKQHPRLLNPLRWFRSLIVMVTFGVLLALAVKAEEPFVATFVQHEDGSKWLSFPTYAGMHFAVERTTDLVTYEAVSGGLFYGDGNPREFYVMDPPPPPPATTSPSTPAVTPVKLVSLHSLTISYANETGVYTVIVSRPGTSANNGWAAALPFTIPKSVAFLASLTIEDADARYVLLFNTTGVPAATIASTPLTTTFSPEQQKERDLIFSHQAEILGALTQTHANVTQPPEPPSTPATPGSVVRYFYRVTCRQIDTNGNGVMDWLEALKHFNPFLDIGDPNAATMSTVDSATNLTLAQIQALSSPPGTLATTSPTGYPITPEDLDGDGVLDELEAIANDANFTYPKSPESSYIAIWLDQLTGPNAMPHNADDTLPELISMNDNGQLFFDYTPPPAAGSEPRRTILVYDQGVYTAMPPFTFQGWPAYITGLSDAKSSTFGGGSIVFTVGGPYDDPLHPTLKYATRCVIWSKANNWQAPVIGGLVGGITGAAGPPVTLDPVPLRLDPVTGEYPGPDIDEMAVSPVYWDPVGSDIRDYDNLGNLLLRAGQQSYFNVTTPSSEANNWTAIWTERLWGLNLGSLHGSALVPGTSYPGSYWSGIRDDNQDWSFNGGPIGVYHFPVTVHATSPSGRTRVAQAYADDVLGLQQKWYQGEAGDPFKTAIFQNAAADATAVNSWNAEAKPPAGSGLPYRQGPLFMNYSTLATLTGSGATAEWHVLTTANGAGSTSSILNDRAEVLTGLHLWRNNHLIDLSPTINATKPTGHPGLNYNSNVKTFLNNQGVIAVKHTRSFGGEWLNHTVLLVPVDVVQPKLQPYLGSREIIKDSAVKDVLEPVSRVRFCRWAKAFGASGFNPDFYKTDPDRFYIRVGSYVPGLTKMELTTNGIHGRMLADFFRPNYVTDGPNELNLTFTDGIMLSPPTLLITSGDDDSTFNGTGVDDGQDDATLLADFDSEIKLKLPEFAGWLNVVARAVKPVKEIKIRTKFFSATGTLAPDYEGEIQKHIETAKEIYRQMGIRIIDAAPPTPVTLPASYAAKTVLTAIETQALALVIKLQIPQLGMAPDEILVAFTDLGFSGVDVDQNNQTTRIGGFVQNILPPVFISLDRLILPYSNAVAHELGHIYTKSGPHSPDSETWRLMLPGYLIQWKNSHEDPRRFNFDEEKILNKSR